MGDSTIRGSTGGKELERLVELLRQRQNSRAVADFNMANGREPEETNIFAGRNTGLSIMSNKLFGTVAAGQGNIP
uniref:Uncharacterized protein n=1 Tax=Setaria digitata TaxID=48799 RepID=A0A915PW97_9BILA